MAHSNRICMLLLAVFVAGNEAQTKPSASNNGQDTSRNLTNELLEARNEIYLLQNERLTLLNKLISLKTEHANFMDDENIMQQRVVTLEKQLGTSQLEVLKLNDHISKLKRKVSDLKNKIAQYEKENNILVQQVRTFENIQIPMQKQAYTLQQFEESLSDSQQKEMKLKNIIKKLKNKIEAFEVEMQGRGVEMTTLQFTNEVVQGQYNACQQHLKKLSFKVRGYKEKIEELSNKLIHLEEHNNYLTTENYHLKTVVSRQNDKLMSLQRENQDFKRENVTFVSLVEKLINNETIFNASYLARDNCSVPTSEELRTRMLQQFDYNVTNLHINFMECATVLSILQKEYDILLSENLNYKAINFNLSSQLNETKASKSRSQIKLSKCMSEIGFLKSTTEGLTEKLITCEKSHDELQEKNKKIGELNFNLQQDNTKLHKEKEGLNDEVEQLNDEIQNLTNNLHAQKSLIGRTASKLNDTQIDGPAGKNETEILPTTHDVPAKELKLSPENKESLINTTSTV